MITSGAPTAATADAPWSNDVKASPPRAVANNPQADNFSPADALESLHTEIVESEALGHAAGEAVTLLPRPANATQGRNLTRIYARVSKVAGDAATAAAHGDKLVASLSAPFRLDGPLASEPSLIGSSPRTDRCGSDGGLRDRRANTVEVVRVVPLSSTRYGSTG